MVSDRKLSHHAVQRMAQRRISEADIALILDYGTSRDAGYGARKFGLCRRSLREIREDFDDISRRHLDRLRRAYVVATRDRIVTAAFANRPVFN